MKKKLFIILGVLVLSTSLVLSFALKKDNTKVLTKEEAFKNSELQGGIMAYTLNGEKTSLSYEYLLNNNTVNKITCKNGSTATHNKEDNSVSLSNIKMPDYCTIDFNHSLYSKLLADNPKVETRTDFSTVYTETNTGTLFKSTESIAGSTAKDVYYFAGDAKNNWVKFGKQNVDGCRYKGDLVYKAIYANDGDGGYIEDAEEITDQNECEITGICATDDYGQINGITSSECSDVEGTWINKTPTYNEIFDIYWRIIRTNHDGSVRLLYSGTSPDTTSGYIGESEFNKRGDPMYVGYMYGTSGTPASNRTNENDSTIKTYIDNWYSNNLTSYTKYISTEAVYCNDREVGRGTYNTGGGVKFYYATYTRLDAGNPTYDCVDTKDAFSGSNTEAKLTYPIGLMTTDEILYAGGASKTDLTSPYTWYYTNSAGGSITVNASWWLLSPGYWNGYNPWLRSVGGLNGNRSGTIYVNMPDNSTKVRPVISIKSDAIWSKGDGSPDSPYEIVYN